MANELTKDKTDRIVSTISKQGLGSLIQPLTKEIHLFDSYIAGITHLNDKSVLRTIQINDTLHLQREKNQFDQKAILVLTSDKKKLGYIPEKDNIIFSRLMDAGKMLTAKIKNIEHQRHYTKVTISIYLVDF